MSDEEINQTNHYIAWDALAFYSKHTINDLLVRHEKVCLFAVTQLNHAIDNLLVHLEQHITRSVFGNTGATALPRWFKKSSSSKTALWPNIMENVICVVVIILFC